MLKPGKEVAMVTDSPEEYARWFVILGSDDLNAVKKRVAELEDLREVRR